MDKAALQQIIVKGKGITVAFMPTLPAVSDTIYETICGFLNRAGGHLLLGVKEDGSIEGLEADAAQEMVNFLITTSNDREKLNPPCYLSPEIIDFEGKTIIHVWIPQSSQVHKTANRIFDRNEDGDVEVTDNQAHLTQLYITKQSTYTENKIFPFMKMSDLREDLFDRTKRLLPRDSPLRELDDLEFLKALKLYQIDYVTGKEGITLAGALIFGKDHVIGSVCPQYKTDALLKVRNPNRYDDRDDIRTNLIEAYERLMAFVEKHLPDPFYLEGDTRISLRNIIFRESIANTLIHREYSNAYPARFIIEKESISLDNWNTPRLVGVLTPDNTYPQPKNPNIANFFKLIGRADELGSGIRNTYKYCKHYTQGLAPQFIEGDVFKTIILLPGMFWAENDTLDDTKKKVLL